jgi:hypothetical protein
MAHQQQPFILEFNGSGTPTQTMVDGTPLDTSDNVVLAVITTPQAGPPEPITPEAVPLDFTVDTVQQPYSLVMPPGVQRA